LAGFCFGLFVKMFGKQKNLLQDGDFILIQTRVSNLELELEKLKSQIISLRGLVNRKLGDFEKPEQTETIKSPDGLDSLRLANKNARSN